MVLNGEKIKLYFSKVGTLPSGTGFFNNIFYYIKLSFCYIFGLDIFAQYLLIDLTPKQLNLAKKQRK